MKLTIFSSLVLVSIVSLSASAQGETSISEINRDISKVIQNGRSIMGSDGSPLHRKIFGGPVSGSNYERFLLERISNWNRIQISMKEPLDPFAFAIPSDGLVFITPGWLDSAFSASLRKRFPQGNWVLYYGSLLHEVRHFDGYPHTGCTSKSQFGKIGWKQCDSGFFGANGVAAIFFKNIEKYCTNCTKEELAVAKYFGDATIQLVNMPARDVLLNELNW
jgi:hypothetical protein